MEASLLIILWIAVELAAIFLVASICLLVKYRRCEAGRLRLEKTLNALDAQAGRNQLESLEARLNPHLFKNVLNSIQSHAFQTYYSLDKLANVLDYILYESKHPFVSVREEVSFALNLIEINKIKLSPLFNLRVRVDLADDDPLFLQNLLAPLITVDLIENAFKHADFHSADSFITIGFGFRAGVFVLNVSNKISGKQPMDKPYAGLGSATLEKRLDLIYKGCYELERTKGEEVYDVSLKIRLNEHKAQMLAY